MKFQDILNEAYGETFEYKGKQIEIFVNPTIRELRDIEKASKDIGNVSNIRFYWDDKKTKLYAWDGYALHYIFFDKMHINPVNDNGDMFGFHVNKVNTDTIYSDWDTPEFITLPNASALIKKLKLIFPHATKLECSDGDVDLQKVHELVEKS